jgi:D-glycero-alpha-D-manno-heptose-7-phosphate kinase
MIITKTPYRLSLFGGGTDYNEWFQEHGGLIIGSSFNKYCWITMRKLPPFFDHKSRVVYSKVENVHSNSEIEHHGVQSCLQYLGIEDGLEIHHDGDLPARSGIGSSSSFTVGFLNALHALQMRMIDKKELAEMAIHVEQNVAKEKVGIQDQILASYGGLQVIEMGPGAGFKVRPLILPPEYKRELESHIMLGFSGMQRFSSDAAAEQVTKIKSGVNTSQLHEIFGIAREGYSLLQKNADFSKLGALFDATWKLKRTLTSNMTNDSLDSLYQKALKLGAYGGRIMGAGNGGFLMLFAPPERHESLRRELKDIKVWVPFKFEEAGSQVIFYNA